MLIFNAIFIFVIKDQCYCSLLLWICVIIDQRDCLLLLLIWIYRIYKHNIIVPAERDWTDQFHPLYQEYDNIRIYICLCGQSTDYLKTYTSDNYVSRIDAYFWYLPLTDTYFW